MMKRNAFTLTEVLVALLIISVLVSLLMMAVPSSRESARRLTCTSNLHQLGLALASYESTHRVFPVGLSLYGSLHVSLLPHLEQTDLYSRIADFRSQNGPLPDPPDVPELNFLFCPSDYTVAGWGLSDDRRGTPWTDGNIGTTLYNHALQPNRGSCHNGASVYDMISTASSLHPQGVNCLFADGHIRFVDQGVARSVWRGMANRAGQD